MKKRVILCPNPSKDLHLETSRAAKTLLEDAGFELVDILQIKKDGSTQHYPVH